ncbi:MAG: penicillin-binding transpeptidase domain-containing protein, partial [Bradymonadaceae bacterium]
YFNKPPGELELDEIATLMGVLPAPSVFNPIDAPQAAGRERNRVLRRMQELGMIDEPTLVELMERPIEVRSGTPAASLPEAVSTVLRHVDEHLGENAWAASGATVVVTHRPLMQNVARESVQRAILDHDKRQGWRGPISRATSTDELDEALRAQRPGQWLVARVLDVNRREAKIITAGGEGIIVLENARWAEPATTPRHYRRPVRLADLRRALNEDDVILVAPVDIEQDDDKPARFALEQWPIFEGAMIAIDTYTGEVIASVGAFDSERSQFHRAEQGCRQPGSVFKSILFAEALAQGHTAATMLSDVPHGFQKNQLLDDEEPVWRPRNADRDFRGYLTLARSLALSRNIPSVHLVEAVGPGAVVERAKKMGVDSTLDPTLSVALGASCVRPLEMAKVHATIQRRGFTTDVSPLAYIIDSNGEIVRDFGHFSDASPSPITRLARMSMPIHVPSQGLSEDVAYIMTHLLRDVTIMGTAHMLPRTWKVGGKTGTSNDYDGWFVGFDGRTTVAAWLGSDRNTSSLGSGEHGATVALPIFERFMGELGLAKREDPWPGEAPDNIVFARIDPDTGLLSRPGESGITHPFIRGTEPTDLAPGRGTRQAEQIDSLLMDF